MGALFLKTWKFRFPIPFSIFFGKSPSISKLAYDHLVDISVQRKNNIFHESPRTFHWLPYYSEFTHLFGDKWRMTFTFSLNSIYSENSIISCDEWVLIWTALPQISGNWQWNVFENWALISFNVRDVTLRLGDLCLIVYFLLLFDGHLRILEFKLLSIYLII